MSTSSGPRWDYRGVGIDDDELPESPWPLFADWVELVMASVGVEPALHEPLAMAVATVDEQGVPDVREVLLRFLDPAGPGFVTSEHSAKVRQARAAGVIAASLTWTPLFRAVRFRGVPQDIERSRAEEYWHNRPWGAKIAALASQQSSPAASRDDLQAAFDSAAQKWPEGSEVPVPDDWAALRVHPFSVEFWVGRPDRLHDRIRYLRDEPGDLDATGWRHERLQP